MNFETIALNTLQSIQELIYIRDLDRNIIYINKAAEQFTGYSLPEAKGKKCYEIFGDENLRCKESCPVGKAISEQVSLTHNEGKLKTKSGENCYLSVSISPFWQEEAITGAVVVMQDLNLLKEKEQTQVKTLVEKEHYINELTQTKNDLQESEKKFRQVVENANEGIFIIQDGIYKFINDYGLRLFERNREELVGAEILEHVHPDDRHFVSERIERRLSGEQIEDIVEHRIIDANGQIKWVETRGVLTSWEGKTASIGFATDITQRKQSEEELRFQAMLLDQIQDRITATDLEGKIVYVNDAELSAMKKTRAELLGQSVRSYGEDPARGATQEQLIENTLKYGKWRTEVVNFASDGTEVILDCRMQLIQDNAGRPVNLVGISSDITERKQAEEALRKSEKRYKRLIDTIPYGIEEVDLTGRMVFLNDAYHHMLGYAPGELSGTYIWDYETSPDDTQKLIDYFEFLKAEQPEPEAYVSQNIRKDGAIIDVHVNWEYVYDEQRALTGFISVVTDITERKKAEEELRANEERLSLALDGGNLGTWDWNIQADEVDFDERRASMKGYPLSEIQPHLNAWKNLLHPDDLPDVMEKLQAHLQGKTDTYEAEFRILDKNGEWLWISDRGKVLQWDEKGNPLRACGIHLDITENKRAEEALRESEEKYRLLAETTSDIIVVHDMKGRILFTNQAGRDFYGLQHSELVGASVFDFIPPEYHATLLSRKEQRSLGDAGMHLYEIEFINNAGQRIPIEVNSTSFLHDGKEQRLLIIARDISKRKQLEVQLQQAQKMEAIGTLAGGIAHDFNNILYPLMGFTEMLKEDVPADSPLHSHIDEILQASFRAKDLVKQILAFSRQGEQELKPIKLQPVIKEALKLLRSTIPTTIDIQQDIDPGCGVVVADPTQVHQILVNLATNAYQAMEETGGSLTVSLEQVRLEPEQILLPELAPGDYARLRVTDTGPGIEKAYFEKIFDPYFTTKETGKGTGLGLSVVQGIVKRAHGDIHIISEPGHGTEVQVYSF